MASRRADNEQSIPIVDVFAGPGGLGEGFARLRDRRGRRAFRTAISIEKDAAAHRTLTLRAFYRQFEPDDLPRDYIARAMGSIDTAELFRLHPRQAEAARREAWLAELGSDAFPVPAVRERVKAALGGAREWVLLGGPPCQAYSLVGRSRNRGIEGYRFEADHRTTLYLEYLQLLADFWPSVFVMENVKGLLSARHDGQSMFARILGDLADPSSALAREGRDVLRAGRVEYDLYSVVAGSHLPGVDAPVEPAGYVVRAERYGIPQARHRVIVIGVRGDLGLGRPLPLEPRPAMTVRDAIGDLPPLRSGLSREPDSAQAWADAVGHLGRAPGRVRLAGRDLEQVATRIQAIGAKASSLANRPRSVTGDACGPCINREREWFEADRMPCVANHESRSHMRPDLLRYLFAAAFAEAHRRSPALEDFPLNLLPAHRNVGEAVVDTHFADRFRVQVWGRHSTTVTSHISRDGHYYIHPDPEQCRSLTVREAARLQTFPDTYLFEGNRTAQYSQVGNAVPPLLAHQIAQRVYDLFR